MMRHTKFSLTVETAAVQFSSEYEQMGWVEPKSSEIFGGRR